MNRKEKVEKKVQKELEKIDTERSNKVETGNQSDKKIDSSYRKIAIEVSLDMFYSVPFEVSNSEDKFTHTPSIIREIAKKLEGYGVPYEFRKNIKNYIMDEEPNLSFFSRSYRRKATEDSLTRTATSAFSFYGVRNEHKKLDNLDDMESISFEEYFSNF